MSELRNLFACTIHPQGGALLRGDGVAVGLVGGGAPPWDLLATADRMAIGDAYHRLLLALDAPLDVYLVDQPPELTDELRVLQERQMRNPNAVQAAILGELAEELTELAFHSRSRAKQVVWTVTVAASGAGISSGLSLGNLLRREAPGVTAPRATMDGRPRAAWEALARAQEKARHLAGALSALGGSPRVLGAEEIARLLYQLADQVRAARYDVAGSLLERVCRVVTVDRGGAP